jgi:sugar lactone lactonase YvrE
MMAGFRFPFLSVSPRMQRTPSRGAFGPIAAAIALLAVLPQAWSATFTVANNTFPSTTVGKSTSQNVMLTVNTAVPITSISIAPGFTEYSITGVTGCTVNSLGTTIVAAGSICTIAVTYSPAVPGSAVSPTLGRNAPLLVSDVESSNPVTYAFGLTGSATAAVNQLEPATLSLFAGAPLSGLPAAAQGLGVTNAGYGGNNGPANEALFSFYSYTAPTGCSPYSVTQPLARDSAGNLYVIDPGNLLIRKIDNTAQHNVTIVAGVPGKGSSTTVFTNAYLNTPNGIVVDAAGNIYFLDTSYCIGGFGMVRRVDAVTGAITSVAGQNFTGTYNPIGGGTCSGNLGSPGYSWECGDGGQASYANIPYATQLAMDAAGNLYVWEAGGGGYIRKIDLSTGIISTEASAAQLGAMGGQAGGMTLASDGNFYVSVDTGTADYIEQFNPNTQAVTQIAGGGNLVGNYCSVTVAQAGYPGSNLFLDGTLSSSGDLSSDGSGNIYVNEGLCEGNGDILDDSAAVWRINLATDYAFLETKSESGDGAQIGYNSFYGYVTAPRTAIPDSLGDLYFVTYNQVAQLSGISGALNYTATIDYTTNPQTLSATYANVGNVAETNPTASFAIGINFLLNSTGDLAACSAISELAIGGTCDLDVEFAPVQAGSLTDTLDLTEAGGGNVGLINNDQTLSLNGSALAEPKIAFAPPTINFGTQMENTVSGDQAVTISNPGTGTLTISNFFPDDGSFTGFQVDTNNPGTCHNNIQVAAGDSCTINVQFAPTTLGNLTEYLIVNSNATNTNVNLTATELMGDSVASLAPVVSLSPNPLAFGGQVWNTTSPAQAVTLSNTGGGALTNIVPTITGANAKSFTLTTGANACGSSLAAGNTCNFYVTFSPKTTGNITATLSVADNANPSPQTVSLTGSYAYFAASVGRNLEAQLVTVYITTPGTPSAIDVLTEGIANLDFSLANGGSCATGTAYTVGQTCTVNVGFDPIYPGARDGAIDLIDAQGNVLGTTYLPGFGLGPQIAFHTGNLSTFASTVESGGFRGVAVDGHGDVFLAGSNDLTEIPAGCSTTACYISIGGGNLSNLTGMAVDGSGNLYVAGPNPTFVMELPLGCTSSTCAISLGGGFQNPDGVAVDGAGNVYVADAYNNAVKEMPPGCLTSSCVTTLGGGFFVTEAVAVDVSGNVYVADNNLQVNDGGSVKEMPAGCLSSSCVTTLATGLPSPGGLAVDAAGDVYFSQAVPDAAGVYEMQAVGGSVPASPTIVPLIIHYVGIGVALDGPGNVYFGAGDSLLKLDTVDPPSLTFASTDVGSTSTDSPQTVPVFNIGNGDLTVDGVSYPANFPENSSDENLCVSDTPVLEGSSCDVSVDFTPTSGGNLSGSVMLFDNNLDQGEATQSIAVSGTGIALSAPAVTLNPPSLTFSVPTGNTSNVAVSTLTNTGTAPLTITSTGLTGANPGSFIETDNCVAMSPIPVNGICTISVQFVATVAGPYSAAVSFVDNASNSPQSLPLNATATSGAPIVTLTPALAFPVTEVSQGQQLMATLANTGNAPLTNIAISITGANAYMFQVYPNGSCYGKTTLAQDSACTISVDFYPPGPGSFAATLVVTDNASNSPQTSALTGSGTESELQFTPGQFNFVAGTPGMPGDTGSGPAISALIGGGYGIALDSTGLVYFSDYDFNTVWQINGNGDINVYAGIPVEAPGHGSYSGDNGAAASATLNAPEQIAFDPSGNLYIADRFNNLIRMVNSAGTITTFAGNYGNGFGGYAGDGGPANQATLNNPQGVTADAQGNVYIADTNNNVVRKVDTTGTITLFAGTPGVSGNSGDNGPATSATLGQIYQLATDLNGNLYIADFGNGVVRKVDSTGTITTYAGGGTAAVTTTPQPATSVNLNNGPVGLATDPAGNLYVLGLGHTNLPGVFLVNTSQQISQIVGGGTTLVNGAAANAENTNLNAIAVDAYGDLYVNDAYDHIVAEIDPNGDLAFPNTPVNTASAPLTVTLSNTGNQPLTFSNQYDDDVVRKQRHATKAKARAAAHSARPDVVDFSSYGTIAGPFAIGSGGTCNFDDGIAAGASCTMNVTFNPTSTGAATGTITLFTNQGNNSDNPNTILLTGTGVQVLVPGATLTPSLPFPNTFVGTTTSALAATLTNTGNGPLTISSIAIGGANPSDFAISTGSNACGTTLAAGATCSIYVTFTPASAAAFSATLTVTDNASPATQSSSLTGTGIPLNPQAINFTQPNTPVTYAPGMTIPLVATGGASGNPVVFTIDSSSTGAGTISGSTLTVTGVGTFVIDANQAGNADYSAAPQVQRSVVIGPAPQTINFTQPATPVTYAPSLTVTLTAAGGASGNAVVFTVDSTSTGTATISGSTLTITGAGKIVIDANQAGNANYSAAPQVQRTIVVNQAPQAINFTQPATPVVFSTGLTITLTATGGASGNAVVFTLDETSTATGSISGNTLTVTSAGNLVIDANQAGNADYSAAPQVQRTVLVNPPPPDFTITATPASQTIAAGASTSFTVTIAATNGTFNNIVTLSASGLPTGATGTLQPGTINPGNSNGTSTFTVQLAPALQASTHGASWPLATPALALLFLLPFRRWRKAWRGKLLLLVAALVSLAGVVNLTACGGGFLLGPVTQTYTITLTGASGNDTHSTTVQLTVK